MIEAVAAGVEARAAVTPADAGLDFAAGTRPSEPLVEAARLARTGNARRALELATGVLQEADAASDLPLRAQATETIADAQVSLAAYADALSRYLEVLSLWRSLADVHGQVRALRGIATVELCVGDYKRALGRFEEALTLLREEPDAALESGVYHGLGMVCARLGDLAKARAFHELALQRRRALNDLVGVAASLNSLGVLCLRAGEQRRRIEPEAIDEFNDARRFFDEAALVADQVGDMHVLALALGNVASAVAFLGDLDQAMTLFERQLAAIRSMNDGDNEALCLLNIGEALRLCGRPDAAIESLQRALAVGEQTKARARITRAHAELSACREALGDHAAALAHYKQFHALDQVLRSEEAEAKARDLVVQIAVRKVREEAEQYRAERDRLAAANAVLSEAAHVDALTGLANRRYLDANLDHMFCDLRASGRSFSMALADIDLFKEINDRHSHVIGDEVLRTVGRILRAACRPSDLAVRYGGEEFVLALPETTLEQARAACQRLRAAVAGHDWHLIQPGLRVTISVGVTGDSGHDDAASMLAAADHKLYDAKHAGRNCVR